MQVERRRRSMKDLMLQMAVIGVLLVFAPVHAHAEFDHAATFTQLPADNTGSNQSHYAYGSYRNNYDFAKYSGYRELLAKFNRHLPSGRGLTILQVETHQTPGGLGTVKRLFKYKDSNSHSSTVANILTTLDGQWWAYTKYRTFSLNLDSFHTADSSDLRGFFPDMSATSGYYPATDYEGTSVTPAKLLNVSNTLGGSNATLVRQLDKFIEENDLVACTAHSGLRQGNWSTSGMAYNSMVVDQYYGNPFSHDGAKLNDHGAPRYKPDLLARSIAEASSWATPVACSAAAMLLERANADSAVANAQNSVVPKAILMAGATRFNYRIDVEWASLQEIATPPVDGAFPLFHHGEWQRTSDALPTSPKYGAGHLNILAAYNILNAGEFNAGGTTTGSSPGWDYASGLAVADVKNYSIAIGQESMFSAVLVWHRYIDDSFASFLPDYHLSVYDSANRRVAHSDSRTSNVELVEVPLPAGTYRVEVKAKSNGGSTGGLSYGLAWIAKKLAPAPQNPGFTFGSNTWTLNWSVNGTATYKHRVQVSTDTEFSTLEKDVYLKGATSYAYTPPTDGSPRYFRVYTYPQDNDVAYTYPSAPSSAMTLTAEAGDGEVMLHWPRNLAATSGDYQMKAGDGTWSDWTPLSNFFLLNTKLLGDLANGTVYRFRVRAVNASGSAVSTEAAATPAAPSNTLVKPTVTVEEGDRQVTLSWAADSAATGWEVQRREPGGAWRVWFSTGLATPGYVDILVANGSEYAYRVRAIGTDDVKGAASDAVLATPAAPAVVPLKPTGLTADRRTATEARLEWSSTGNESIVTEWQYRHKTAGGAWGAWTTMPGRHGGYTGYTVTGLTAGTDYVFQVRGVNTHGTAGPESDEVTAQGTPAAVASVSVTHNGTSLTVSWEAAAGATHYDVTYNGGGVNARAAWNYAGITLTITCDSRPEHQNQNCVNATTTYTVGVRARNAAGESAWVDSARAAPPGTPETLQPPAAVASVNVTHNGTNLSVSWDAPARATHYDVTYSGGGVNARAAWNRAGTTLTITCDSRPEHQNQNCVNATTTYTVGVRARNSAGESAWVNSAPASPPAES